MDDLIFYCYSRKLMYWLGLHDINFIEKQYNTDNGRPYWTFNKTPELNELLSAWGEFKATTTNSHS